MSAVIDPTTTTAADADAPEGAAAPIPFTKETIVAPGDSPELDAAKQYLTKAASFGYLIANEEAMLAYNALSTADKTLWEEEAKRVFNGSKERGKFAKKNLKEAVAIFQAQDDLRNGRVTTVASDADVIDVPDYEDSHLPKVVFPKTMHTGQKAQLLIKAVATMFGDELYTQESKLVRVRIGDNGSDALIEPVTVPIMEEMVIQSCRLYERKPRTTQGGAIVEHDIPIAPPENLLRNLVNKRLYPFPILKGIRKSPLLFRDGSIVQIPGYDQETRYIYKPHDGAMPPVPDTVTQADAIASREWLHEHILSGFKFDSQASYANAFAYLLTHAIRPFIKLAPMAVIEAPTMGSGKGLLAESVAHIYLGKNPGAITNAVAHDPTELRKTLVTLVKEGAEFLYLDNITGVFGSGDIESFLTAVEISGRLLGGNHGFSGRNLMTPVFTGNNAQIKGDMPRRVYRVYIDTKSPNPSERPSSLFRHSLHEWIDGDYEEGGVYVTGQPHRGEILHHIYTILRAWMLNGRPAAPNARNMANYEEWCAILAGALHFAGVEGFLANQDAIRNEMAADIREWESFFHAWHRNYEIDTEVRASEVLEDISLGWRVDPLNEDYMRGFRADEVPMALVANRNPKDGGFITRVLSQKIGQHFDNEVMFHLEKQWNTSIKSNVFLLRADNPGALGCGDTPPPPPPTKKQAGAASVASTPASVTAAPALAPAAAKFVMPEKPRRIPVLTPGYRKRTPKTDACVKCWRDDVNLVYPWGVEEGIALCQNCYEAFAPIHIEGRWAKNHNCRWTKIGGYEGYAVDSLAQVINECLPAGTSLVYLTSDYPKTNGFHDVNYEHATLARCTPVGRLRDERNEERKCVGCHGEATRELWTYSGAYVCDSCARAVSFFAEKPDKQSCPVCRWGEWGEWGDEAWRQAPYRDLKTQTRYNGLVHACIEEAIISAVGASRGKQRPQ